MPRPETITDEDIARWREEIELAAEFSSGERRRTHLRSLLSDPEQAERLWYPGAWLGEELAALGCNPALKQRICQSIGPQLVHSAADGWEIAEGALEMYRKQRVPAGIPTLRESDATLERHFPELARARQQRRKEGY